MSAINTVLDPAYVASVLGYSVERQLAELQAGNLLQKIVILAEANAANQVGLPDRFPFTSAEQVGEEFGFGSPSHIAALQIRPLSDDTLGAIVTEILPQAEAVGSTSSVKTATVTTAGATANKRQLVEINGREGVNGQNYDYVVNEGDTDIEIADKAADAVNSVIGAPVIADSSAADGTLTFTTKWNGETSADLYILFLTPDGSAGVDYAVADTSTGAGVPEITDSLALIAEKEWVTIIVNTYGNKGTVFTDLETWNGTSDAKTGRYAVKIFRPALALMGTNETDINTLIAITAASSLQQTNVVLPAPATKGWQFEIPAVVARIYGALAQKNPSQDMLDVLLSGIPAPKDTGIGDIADFQSRNDLVLNGVSTTIYNVTTGWQMQDFVTTFHSAALLNKYWLWDRVTNSMMEWNIRYGVFIQEEIHLKGKKVVNPGVNVTAGNTITLERWKGILVSTAITWQERALIESSEEVVKSLTTVKIGRQVQTVFVKTLTDTVTQSAVESKTNFS